MNSAVRRNLLAQVSYEYAIDPEYALPGTDHYVLTAHLEKQQKIGQISWTEKDDTLTIRDKPKWWVSEDFRGNGLGSELMRLAHERALDLGFNFRHSPQTSGEGLIVLNAMGGLHKQYAEKLSNLYFYQ